MERQRPQTLLVMGASCCVFAAFWFLWLFLAHAGDFLDLLAVAFGNREPLAELARHNLASAGPIRFTLALFAAQTALTGVLVWTGCALLRLWRSGRRCAVAYSVSAIAVALVSTIARLFFLTLPGETIKVTPFLLDAFAILFANVLCGTMFLPEVTAAYAGGLEQAGGNRPLGVAEVGPH